MKKKSIILIIIGFLAFFFILIMGYFKINLGCVDKKEIKEVEFTVNKGEALNTIIKNLKDKDLIRNELVVKLYVRINPGVPQAGKYIFKKNMTVKEIYSQLVNGNATYDTVWVTFVEGKRLSYIVDTISKNFPYTKEEINKVIDDKVFINELISKYDVLTPDILKSGIYHPLEGYLYPDTYEFLKDLSIRDIIEKMVATTDSKFTKYKEVLKTHKLNVHEIMTLASIVEMEGTNSDNRPKIASVFMNRLNSGWSLGSDVTAYYGVNKDFDRDLTVSDLNNNNPYNTRLIKGLPIGPIASVGIESIDAAVNPVTTDYYYFVSDKNKKIYFSKTDREHNNTINELRRKGLWYTYK